MLTTKPLIGMVHGYWIVFFMFRLMETTRSKAMFYCFHNAAFNKLEYFQERNDAEAIRTTIAEGKRILELYLFPVLTFAHI